MFTGIIEKQGRIVDLVSKGNSLEIRVDTDYTDLQLGESIAVNGVCLTVAQFSSHNQGHNQGHSQGHGEILFFISPETLQRSNLGSVLLNSFLNLERALTLNTRLSGHLVQGHVDGKAKLLKILSKSDSYSMQFEISGNLSKYCVEKGSICLNGVSLTLNSVSDPMNENSLIEITVIPHTWSHTNLSRLSIGDWVNAEVDILAKYVERLCHH